MSFVVRVGESEGNDRRLAVVRKKYFHNILEFNQQSQRDRQEQAALDRHQTNLKFTQIHHSLLEQLEAEAAARQREKLIQQETLREEYERQIHDRREKLRKEREGDKKYVRLQLIETEKVSQRRVADLMKIYDRAAVRATHRRTRTEPDGPNPEAVGQKEQSYSRLPFLPAIDRIHATSALKSRPEQGTAQILNQSHRSLTGFNRTGK